MAQKEISFVSRDSEFTIVEEERIETEIEIFIGSIENLIRENDVQIKFKVEHRGVTLGESEMIKIEKIDEDQEEQSHILDFSIGLPYCSYDPKSIRPLVSTPVLITVFEVVESPILPQKKNGRRKSKLSTNLQQSPSNELKTLGLCNVDLLPLILGERNFEEKLVLETPSYSWDNDGVSWENLPRITISVSQDESDMMMKDADINIMSITVESIYNLPSCFTEYMDYKCGTVTFTDKDDSRIAFEGGKWTDYHDVERTKTWKSLRHLDSRARFSKYKIDCDYECVKNEFHRKFDLKNVAKRDEPRIEWNCMDRLLLESHQVQSIQEQLIKYKCWPFEIMINEKGADQLADGIIYQFYVDVSQLLFPGRNKTRVLAQLFTQSSSDMQEKTGLNTGIFNNDIADESENRRDSFMPNSLSSMESEWKEKDESIPLFTENGEPVLILIEFELLNPLYAARTLEEYTQAIGSLKKTTRVKAPFYYYTPDIAHEQYMNCVKHLVDVIAETYRDFTEKCECKESVENLSDNPCNALSSSKFSDKDDLTCPYVYIPDELSRFKQYLHEKGKYVSIRSTLKNKIVNLLDQKFAINSPDWYDIENQNLVSSCYTYFSEQMHVALNTKLDVRCADEPDEPQSFKQLWIRAEEACEFEDYDKADKLFVEIICNHRKNADSWIVYAIFHMRRFNVDEAVECCREAIKLDSRHKIALLFYGIILASKEEYYEAEIFLTAVTQLYPRFAEGWAVLHLFYIKIQYYPGIDLTLCIAEECLKDRIRDNETMKILNEEPIAWSTTLCKNDRIFLLTACLLLKLNLYSFVGLALTQDICHNDKSIAFLYFSSVNRYLQQSYSTVIECLEEAESLIGLEFSVVGLLGHAHYKSDSVSRAMTHYESVDMMYERPENIHLVHLRLGFYLIDIEEYERARNVLTRACKHTRTCKTWLGVGICSYFMERFDECEMALMEANRIDCEDPDVWGYLCLLSIALQRYEEFTQCYRMMIKNSLRNDKLWRLIRESMIKVGYLAPFGLIEEKIDRCTC